MFKKILILVITIIYLNQIFAASIQNESKLVDNNLLSPNNDMKSDISIISSGLFRSKRFDQNIEARCKIYCEYGCKEEHCCSGCKDAPK